MRQRGWVKFGIGLIPTKIFGRKCKHSIKGGESADPGDAVVVRSSEDERTEGNEGEEALSAEAAAREEEGVDQLGKSTTEIEVAQILKCDCSL